MSSAITAIFRGGERGHVLFVALLVVAVLVANGFLLGSQPFWTDEVDTWKWVTGPADRLVEKTSTGNHPPLYYQVLRGWIAVGGDSEVWIRFLSTLFAAAAVPASYVMGRAVGGNRTGLVVAALVATSPFLSAYAREAREYAMVVFACSAAFACLACILSQRGGTYPLGSSLAGRLHGDPLDWERVKSDLLWCGLAAFSALAVFTSFVALLLLVVTASILAFTFCLRLRYRCLVANTVIVHSAVLLLFAAHPYGLKAALMATIPQGVEILGNKPVLRAMAEMAPAYSAEHIPPTLLLSGFLVAVAVWRWYTSRQWSWLALGLLGAFLAPVLAWAAGFVLGTGIYKGRTLLWVMVPFFSLLAAGVAGIARPRARTVLLVAVLAVNVYGWAMEAQVTKPAWGEVYRTLESRFQQGDAVVFCSGMVYKMIKYHAHRDEGSLPARLYTYRDSEIVDLQPAPGITQPYTESERLWVIGFNWRRGHCTNPSEHHDVAFRHTVEYGQGVPSVQIHDQLRRTPLSRHLPERRYVFIEAHVPP